MTKNPTLARLMMSKHLNLAASRAELPNPDEILALLLPAAVEIEASALEQLNELRTVIAARGDRLEAERAEWARDREILTRQRDMAEAVAGFYRASTSEDLLTSPRGFYVYHLWSAMDEVLYVGMSTNILARLGKHLSDPDRRDHIARITTVEYPTASVMRRMEGYGIRTHRPPWNIQGVRDDDAA